MCSEAFRLLWSSSVTKSKWLMSGSESHWHCCFTNWTTTIEPLENHQLIKTRFCRSGRRLLCLEAVKDAHYESTLFIFRIFWYSFRNLANTVKAWSYDFGPGLMDRRGRGTELGWNRWRALNKPKRKTQVLHIIQLENKEGQLGQANGNCGTVTISSNWNIFCTSRERLGAEN